MSAQTTDKREPERIDLELVESSKSGAIAALDLDVARAKKADKGLRMRDCAT